MTSVLFGLRLGRWGMVGFSAAAAVSIFVQTAGFYQVAGQSAGDRAAFGASMATLAARFVALFPPPIRPDTVGGYVEFRGFHPLALIFAVWALASATLTSLPERRMPILSHTCSTSERTCEERKIVAPASRVSRSSP